METKKLLFNREIKDIPHENTGKLKISVLQWNTLARCYSRAHYHPKLKPEIVSFDYRKNLIAEEIKTLNADLVCLEEVDETDLDFYKEVCNEETYSFRYAKKHFSKDGNCI